jgi:hypothetical protein
MQQSDLDNRFRFHPAKDAEQGEVYSLVRTKAKEFAEFIDSVAPDGREKSLAITHVEESMFWTNAAIARVTA